LIQVSRSIIRQFRTVMKKSIGLHCVRGAHPPVVLRTDSNGLTINSGHGGIVLCFQTDGPLSADEIVISARALDEFEGRDQSTVELEKTSPSMVLARWTDHAVPKLAEFDMPAIEPAAVPEMPAKFASNDRRLRKALDDAMQIVSNLPVKYATDKLQLRGGGEIAATDGGQLLWQSGFQFPWTGDALVPQVKLFGCNELYDTHDVLIGKTDTHVCIRCGAWTIFLPIDKEARFPRVENVIPKPTDKCSRLRLDPSDSAFLARTLPRLPGNEGPAPVTLNLNGHVELRAKADDQERATVVALSRSTASSPAIRYAVNRGYVARAVHLGFSEIQFDGADKPAMCQDDHRKYIFVGLGKDAAIAPSNNELRLASDGDTPSPPRTERTKPTVKTTSPPLEPTPISNGYSTNGESKSENGQHKANFSGLLEEAQALQNMLRDMLLRTNQLITGLKHYHKTTKAMRATLASLRQLQQLEV
jgi:hypothetical protein